MKELDAIIDEQALLLKWYGYTEKRLHNGEAEHSYKEHLKLAVQELLEKDIFLLDKEPFQVQLFGFFNQQKDKVLFTFSYEYDSFLSQITLKEIEARLNDVPVTIPVEKESDIWTSEKLYQRVKLLSTGVNTALEQEHEKRIKNIIAKESELLYDQGYAGDLEKHFAQAINKAESEPHSEHHFIIKGKSRIGREYPYYLHYRLHYSYHPKAQKLNLKSIRATVDKASRTVMGTKQHPVPPALDVYEFLLQENKALTAKKIMNQPSQPGNSKKQTP